MTKTNAVRVERIEPVVGTVHWDAAETPRRLFRNRLLQVFPSDELRRWGASLDLVRLSSGQVLAEPGVVASYVYFPVDCIVSLVYLTQDGGSTEVASVGNEGVVGVSLFIAGSSGATQAVVQCAGLAYRMKVSLLREEFNRSPAVRQVLLRYMHALLTQSSQMAVCNRHHTVEQQLCRWLLMALDRSDSNQLSLTQEMIANALGVRRAGVTEAASRLRKSGLLRCQRGKMLVLDRVKLERQSCECYYALKREFAETAPPLGASETRAAPAGLPMQAGMHLHAPPPPGGDASPMVVKRFASDMRPAANGSHYYNGQAR